MGGMLYLNGVLTQFVNASGIVNTGAEYINVRTFTYTVGSSYTDTVLSNDEVLYATTGANASIENLPAATGSGRKILIIKADSGAGAITVTPNGSDMIEAAATISLASQYNKAALLDVASGLWSDLALGGQ